MSECRCKPCTDHTRKWAEALEVAVEIVAAPHTKRDPFTDTCVTCWSRIPPRRATLVTDDVPRTATTTGGV